MPFCVSVEVKERYSERERETEGEIEESKPDDFPVCVYYLLFTKQDGREGKLQQAGGAY